MQENYCPNCGAKLDDDSMFCTECGNKLESELINCPECGAKLKKDSTFCPKCGKKLKDKESQTQFCQHCGEKIDINAEICPHCGVRLKNPLADTASSALNTVQKGVDEGVSLLSKYLTFKNVTIVILVLIIIGLVIYSPTIIDHLTPYKKVDSTYIANPVPNEKVQFDAEYVGHTGWNSGIFYFYFPITENDILKVGDQYIILQGDYLGHGLYGHEGQMVHLEGRFPSTGVSTERMADGYIDGHWFGADTIELI